jgi:NADH pyrophosphatase NudC (nudix superfamily)
MLMAKVIGGEIKRQESEIQEIQLFSLKELPQPLAFERNNLIKDYLSLKR